MSTLVRHPVERARPLVLAPARVITPPLAAGGPIVYPEMEAFILTPICPFTLSNRPTVVPASEILRVEVEPTQKTGVAITVDGQGGTSLVPGDQVFVRRAAAKALIIRSSRRSFYDVLRGRLGWAGEPNA